MYRQWNWPSTLIDSKAMTALRLARSQSVAATGATAVDLSSGVEDSPGRKSPEKIAAFLRLAATL